MTHEWMPIETAPRKTTLRFKFADNTEVESYLEPYWCGSDCPCGFDGTEPECWGLPGFETDPTHWKPLPAPEKSP